jgi:peptide/nickel transport system permease protein
VAAFLVRRIAQGLVVMALVATIVFLLVHAAPGDPFSAAMENPSISESIRAEWRRAYGLDQPVTVQYTKYVASVFRGELGFSFSKQRPVAHVLGDAVPNTLALMLIGLAAAFAIGIATAVAQVKNRGKLLDRILNAISLTLFSVPDFWLALLMLVALAYWIPIFPIGGSIDPSTHDYMSAGGRLVDRVKHIILPALTLALLYFPLVARHQRASLLDVLPSEFVATARAKGLSESAVIGRHALRNALLPIITLIGVAFPALLTGAVFVEKVFSWPGMGSVIVNSIASRDYPLLTASVILGSAFVIVGSIIADLLYRVLDPRLRDER